MKKGQNIPVSTLQYKLRAMTRKIKLCSFKVFVIHTRALSKAPGLIGLVMKKAKS